MDIHDMLVDVRSHVRATGRPVELHDDPLQRDLGYRDGEMAWTINMTDVKRSLTARPDETVWQGMKSLAGRLALANAV